MAGEDDSGAFARFKLDGDRFEGARLPVDALVELERYRTLVLEAAQQAWLDANPGQPVPDDFAETFDLAISRVDDGSATSVLEKPDSVYDEYYEAGRDNFEAAFQEIIQGLGMEAAEAVADPEIPGIDDPKAHRVHFIGREVASTLSRIVDLPEFSQLGSSLHQGEALFVTDTADSSQGLTQSSRSNRLLPFVERVHEVRQALGNVEAVSEPGIVKRVSTVAGRLVAMNADKTNFKLKSLVYGEVHGRYKKGDQTDDLKAVLNSTSRAPVVRITGRMSWRGSRLLRILDVAQIELFEIEGEPWSARLVELASLPDGWSLDEEASSMISFPALDAAREMLRYVSKLQGVPIPGIFPMEDGGVELEWATPDRVTSVEISPDLDFLVHDFVVKTRTGTEFETKTFKAARKALRGALQ